MPAMAHRGKMQHNGEVDLRMTEICNYRNLDRVETPPRSTCGLTVAGCESTLQPYLYALTPKPQHGLSRPRLRLGSYVREVKDDSDGWSCLDPNVLATSYVQIITPLCLEHSSGGYGSKASDKQARRLGVPSP